MISYLLSVNYYSIRRKPEKSNTQFVGSQDEYLLDLTAFLSPIIAFCLYIIPIEVRVFFILKMLAGHCFLVLHCVSTLSLVYISC